MMTPEEREHVAEKLEAYIDQLEAELRELKSVHQQDQWLSPFEVAARVGSPQMSEVLRDIEAGAHSQTAQAKRIDAVVMALADVYGKLDALTVYLDGDASDEAATAAIARLLDRSYADGILRAAKQIDSMSPEKLDEYNQRLRKREVGNPSGDNRFWSTDGENAESANSSVTARS